MRIALCHPHPDPLERLAEALRFGAHEVTPFADLQPLFATPFARRFDLLVASAGALWRHEPRRGLAALRTAHVPVLALASAADADALASIDVDGYLLEPFGAEELALRIDVLGRRARLGAPSLQLAAPPYEFHADRREASLHGLPVHLTAREFELALYFFRRVGRRVARDEIAEQVWGRLPHAESRTLDAHVSNLRRKLVLEPRNGYQLSAQYGRGYCLQPVGGHAS